MSDYTIIGDDGEEYGPASEQELRNWIEDGRVDAHTLIRQAPSGEWRRASQHPEFSRDLAAAPATRTALARQTTGAPQPPPPAAALAKTGLVCGILSVFTWCCCPIFSIPGVACSAFALAQIRENPQRIGGKGMAIVGLILSLASAALFVVMQFAGAAFNGFFEGLQP